MTTLTAPATTTDPSASRVRGGARKAGIVAGPLFVTTAVVQILVRDQFDLTRHPISLLANGPFGWVQSVNFIVAGVLSVIFAWAAAPALRHGRGAQAGPVLLAGYGAGLIIGGVFPADPAMGFPAGAPAGAPDHLSTSGIVHAFAPPLAFLCLIGACFVLASRFAQEGHRAAAVVTRLVAVTCVLLTLPVGPGFSVRLFVAAVIGFAWVTALAGHLRSRG